MDLERLRLQLSQSPRQLGVMQPFCGVRPQFQLHWQYCIDSTNRELWHLLNVGAPSGTVLMATTQSRGRGQWGRQWQSPPGGVYLSLGLCHEVSVQHGLYLTLASSWGLVSSLRNLGIPAQVKWPNDVVLAGKKLAGVLVETHLESNHIRQVVIGVGLNGFNPVPSTGISIAQHFQPDLPPLPMNTLEGLAAMVLYGLLQGYLYWQNYGNQALLNAYETVMANLGQTINVHDYQAQVIGVASSGNLRVQPFIGHRRFAHTLEIEPGKLTLGYNA